MKYVEIQAIRLICEGAFKERILKKVEQLGAVGYTWWEAHGKGQHEIIANPFNGLDRVYVEIWCPQEVCDRIVEHFDGAEYHNQGLTIGAETLKVSEKEASKYL